MSKARSARGELVDFDLLKIKRDIASSPKPAIVQAREDFIEKRAKRRNRKLKSDITTQATDVSVETSDVDEDTTEE